METKYLGTINVRRPLTEEEKEAIWERRFRAAEFRLRRRLMIKQKLSGFAMLGITILIFVMAAQGDPTNPIDTDATAALLTGPMALWMLFSRKINIYASNRDFRELDKLEEMYHNG